MKGLGIIKDTKEKLSSEVMNIKIFKLFRSEGMHKENSSIS
jgi:hypothetical protein